MSNVGQGFASNEKELDNLYNRFVKYATRYADNYCINVRASNLAATQIQKLQGIIESDQDKYMTILDRLMSHSNLGVLVWSLCTAWDIGYKVEYVKSRMIEITDELPFGAFKALFGAQVDIRTGVYDKYDKKHD